MIGVTFGLALGASLFLPAGLIATQITISAVAAEREGERLAVTVTGDAMIDPEAASTKLSDGYLYLYIRDARVREANRAWKNDAVEGAEDIRAHRHRQRIELAVPLTNSGCQGSVELEKTPGGLRALIDCDDAPRPASARVARAREAAKTEAKTEAEAKTEPRAETQQPVASPAARAEPAAARELTRVVVTARTATAPAHAPAVIESPDPIPPATPAPAMKVAAPVRLSTREAAALKAQLTLEPARPPSPTPVAASAPAAAVAPAPVFASLPLGQAAPGAVTPVTPSAPSAPVEPHKQAATAGGGGGGGTSGGVVVAGLVLLAIAGGAFFFSRRRTLTSRHIRIIETASLGPKRAIIMARIGDATMILGSSEAGITLLQTLPSAHAEAPSVGLASVLAAGLPTGLPTGLATGFAAGTGAGLGAGVAAAPAASPSSAAGIIVAPGGKIDVEDVLNEPAGMAPSDGASENARESDSAGEGDAEEPVGQAGLLARLFRRGKPANDPALMPRFEDLLEDSFEDQELRRKLALGLGGRVR